MYKILIVDDEPIIRKGFKNKIDWKSYGFEFVAEAKNGLEALALAKDIKPDVIFADMKMPIMDGVELLNAIKKSNLTSKIITISAYSNFYYTQTAIKCGAFDYILKPIDNNELVAVVKKLKRELDKENSNCSTNSNSDSTENSINNARDAFLDNFSNSYMFDKTNVMPKILDLEIPLGLNQYLTCVLYLKNIVDNNLYKKIESHTKKVSKDTNWNTTTFINPIYSNHIFIIWGSNKESISSFKNNVKSLHEIINANINFPISIGTGVLCNNFNEINRSFLTSINSLNYRGIQNANTVIFYDEIKDITIKPISFSPEKENTFLLSLEICNWDEIKFNIDSLFNMIKNKEEITFRQVYKLCSELLFLSERLLRKYDSSIENIFDKDITSIDYIATTGSLDRLKDWFTRIIHTIMNQIKIKKSKEMGNIIDSILTYINEHYFEDISLSDLSKKYHLNKSYLSTLFKDYTGENFVDSLTSIRMEKAAEILKEKKIKIYEVAKMVGYNDARYFSKLFKKHHSILPTKYHKQKK